MKRYLMLSILTLCGQLVATETLAAERTLSPDQVYDRALEKAEAEAASGGSEKAIALIYLKAANTCRDNGGVAEAVKLYELASDLDPRNAHIHRTYGDYLMGYRGLYEQAQRHYHDALALVRENPNAYDKEFVDALERSFQILHRDGGDGVPLLRSRDVSIFLTAGAGYKRSSPGSITLNNQQVSAVASMNRREQELRDGIAFTSGTINENKEGISFFSEQVDGTLEHDEYLEDLLFPNGPVFSKDEIIDFKDDGTPITINSAQAANEEYRDDLNGKIKLIKKDKAANEAKIAEQQAELDAIPAEKKSVPNRLPLSRESYEAFAEFLVRFGAPCLPYIKASYEHVEIDKVSINPEDLAHPYDGTFRRLAIALGKDFLLRPRVDAFAEVEAGRQEAEIDDRFRNQRVAREDTDELGVRAELAYHAGFNTVKLKLGASVASMENDDSDDDAANTQTVALRGSSFPPPGEIVQTDRFKGRRSTHWEVGVRRRERDFKSRTEPTTTETVYRPYVSYEELGLFSGSIDLALVYAYEQQDISRGTLEGEYDEHEVTVLPIWVLLYRLYDNDFWTGLEHLTLGFPIKLALGEGEYDHYSVGASIQGRYVTRGGFAWLPTLSAESIQYTDLDEQEWGVYAKLIMSSGARRIVND